MKPGHRIVAATGLDPGDREYQQDQLCLLHHPRNHGCILGVLADGMGGRSGGRLAADQVILTAQQLFERYDPASDDAEPFLRRLVHEAHLVIRLTAVAADKEPHSTIAAFVLNPAGDCHWIHCGDSRLHHFQQDHLAFRTKDHSYVQALLDSGQISESEARDHPRSNVLLNCLGGHQEPVASVHTIAAMAAGDTLLVCSDGLWHHFTDDELGHVVHELPPRAACELLIRKAKNRSAGRGDNISLIVLKFEPLQQGKPVGNAATKTH